MSKYAVVKIGASQEKVSIGDELVVSSSFSETTLIPILVSPKKGELVSDNKELKKFKVEIQDIGIGTVSYTHLTLPTRLSV